MILGTCRDSQKKRLQAKPMKKQQKDMWKNYEEEEVN